MAYVRTGDYEKRHRAEDCDSLNPMNCGFRLRPADSKIKLAIFVSIWLLTFGVFERASEARHLTRAFLELCSMV